MQSTGFPQPRRSSKHGILAGAHQGPMLRSWVALVQQLSAVGLVDRRDSFAATFGVTRGHAGLNALLSGQNTPPARAEAARLAAQARAGDYAESLEILHRILASKPILIPVVAGPKVSRPMELVLTALVEGAAARTAESTALRTKKLMDELMLRTRSCQHIIYEQDRATGERVLHFTAAPDRLRGANDSLDLVCGCVLRPAKPVGAGCSWRMEADRQVRCRRNRVPALSDLRRTHL